MIDAADSWEVPPSSWELGADEVHVWRVQLEQPDERVNRLNLLLAHDGRRFAPSGFAFRAIAASSLSVGAFSASCWGATWAFIPKGFPFGYGDYGKPTLNGERIGSPLQFNLSHSGEGTLVGVTLSRPIGIDLELIHPMVNMEELAARFFAPREVEMLRMVTSPHRERAFFNCWTRKEAYLKGCGEGLFRPLDQFVVSLIPDEAAALPNVNNDPSEPSRLGSKGIAPLGRVRWLRRSCQSRVAPATLGRRDSTWQFGLTCSHLCDTQTTISRGSCVICGVILLSGRSIPIRGSVKVHPLAAPKKERTDHERGNAIPSSARIRRRWDAPA